MPLTLRVTLIAAALMIGMGAVASSIAFTIMGRLQDDRLREYAQLQVDGLMVALGPAIQRRDVWEVFDILDRAREAVEGDRLRLSVVADNEGRVVAASDPRIAPVDSDFASLSAGAQVVDLLRVTAREPTVSVIADLVHEGQPVGHMLVELDVTDVLQARNRVMRGLIVGNALATLVLAAATAWALQRMLGPIRRLARHMAATEGYPVPFRLPPTGDREIDGLVQTHNAMAQAVAARAEAERRLAERERYVSLGRLASSLAHEVNNPLGGLLNAVDTIRTYADRPNAVRDAAELLDRGLRHMRAVTGAMLDQHRPERLGSALTLHDFADLRLLLAAETAPRGQTLDWRIDAEPAALAAFPATPVRQIALNLLLNASQAAGSGGRVSFAVARQEGGLRLMVSDDGPGLEPAALDRLLTSRAGVGAPGGGMGLRTVRELADAQAGRVGHARVDGTTRIVVDLPARPTP